MRLVHSIARYRLTLRKTRYLASRLAGKIVIQNEMTIQILKDVFSDFHKQKTQPITHVVIIGAQKQLSLTYTGACVTPLNLSALCSFFHRESRETWVK